MKIGLASDLHFEFHKSEPYWLPELPLNCDVLILAGDIGVGNGAVAAVQQLAEIHTNAQILFIAGNHEFYRQNIEKQLEHYREAFSGNDKIHFLENDSIEIQGYNFLGCTLWTGFGALGWEHTAAAMEESALAIADFSVIKSGEESKKFTPQNAASRFAESCRWIKQELESSDPEKCIVVTHFPPCKQARNNYFKESLLTPYFQADCQTIIERYQPALWCYGHNHCSDDFNIGQTRIVSNQLGYPKEGFYTGYKNDKIIEL